MYGSGPWGDMRIPSPQKARTLAGALLAAAVLVLAADLLVVQVAGDNATTHPFLVETENSTAVGVRITNAGAGDAITAYEMLGAGACGSAYLPATRPPVILHNNTLPANGTADGSRTVLRSNMATGDGHVNWTFTLNRPIGIAGNVTFYVVESAHTADLLRGLEVPTYVEDRRNPGSALTLTTTNVTDPANETDLADSTDWTGSSHRIVIIRTYCNMSGGVLHIERVSSIPPGEGDRDGLHSTDPMLYQLPEDGGVDFLYVVDRRDNDNETYALLVAEMQRNAEVWSYIMREATVYDDAGVLPDSLLRGATALLVVAALGLLALSARKRAVTLAPTGTEAAMGLAAVGEAHLRRLRNTWALVGAMLVPLLAAASLVVWWFVEASAGRPSSWWWQILGLVALMDLAVLALWALQLRRIQSDLHAWRRAWEPLDRTDLDVL